MTYTKEELLAKAAHYFAQGVKVMWATEDGNFFYDEHKHHAKNHASTSITHLHKLTKEDFDNLSKPVKENEEVEEIREQEMPKRGRKPITEEENGFK
jgi:hypothetical protein